MYYQYLQAKTNEMSGYERVEHGRHNQEVQKVLDLAWTDLKIYFERFDELWYALCVLECLHTKVKPLNTDKKTLKALINALTQRSELLICLYEEDTRIRYPREGLFDFIVENLTQEDLIQKVVTYVLYECVRAIEHMRDNSSCEGPDHDENMRVLRKVAEPLLGKWKDYVNAKPLTWQKVLRVLETGTVDSESADDVSEFRYDKLYIYDCDDVLCKLEAEAERARKEDV